ncbi:MAG: F0F1 ATP synthase subunit delta [Betaproteobacteria bacterium]|jgi:F-type H+-transporting ATPase subunit delta
MAEIATIARPYAEALFKAAGAQAAALSAEVGALAAVAADEHLRQFADNPKTSPEQVFGVVAGVVNQPLSAAAQNFLRTVLDNGRLAAMPEIASQFHALVNAQSGVSDALIESAFPIEPSQLPDVVATLEQRFSRKLNARVELRPELIGGIRVTVGDEVLDASVKARLDHMKVALTA